MYPPEITIPMAQELTSVGFEEVKTADKVKAILENESGTLLVAINSVCGCAAGNARPALKRSLQNEVLPDNRITVFAGVDREATAKVREYLLPYPPSSPSIALFKDGKLVHMIERLHIEGVSANRISEGLKEAYNTYCK
jgi:putative YphP/YqiW family bacilliredoxin